MINIFILLLIIIGIILLQVYLSKKQTKRYGLVLPSISLLLSIFALLNIHIAKDDSVVQIIITLIYSFIFSNIPTCIFLAIYYKYHNKVKMNN